MAESVKPAEEDTDNTPGVRVISKVGHVVTAREDNPAIADPFAKSLKDMELSGLGDNARQRKSRMLKKAHTGTNGARSKQNEPEATGYQYLEVVNPPHDLNKLAQLPFLSPTHYAAIRAKQASVVGLGFRLVESPKTKRKLESIENPEQVAAVRKRLLKRRDDVMDFLEDSNDEDSFTEVLEKVWFDYESLGVAYIEIGRENIEDDNGNRKIGYIGHIPAVTMRVRRKRDGYVQIVSNKVRFFRNFGEKTADPFTGDENPNEIIMLKKYSGVDTFYGTPDILAADKALAGNDFAARFNLDYFENKAVPRHVIVLKGAEFSPMAERSITEFFETGVRGVNHRSLYVPLPGDTPAEKVSLEIKPVEAGIQDQSFEKYKKSNISDILQAHRVPASRVGVMETGGVAAALDATKTYKEQLVSPNQRMLENKVNKVMKEITPDFLIEFNELSLTDEDTQAKIDETYLRNQVIVPNEVRARKGLTGLEGGDKVIELNAQRQAEARADTRQSRSEDRERSSSSTDVARDGRNPKGEGRTE